MSYAAFFDLDHTILKINSGEALLRRAYKNGLLSTGKLIQVYCLFVLYKAHLLDPLTIIEKISAWLTESTVEQIEMLCNEIVVKDLIPAVRPEIISRINMHKAEGAQVVMLGTSKRFGRTRVRGPGQKRSASCLATGGKPWAKDSIDSIEGMWTISGSLSGRSLASKTFAQAAGSSAPAPSP